METLPKSKMTPPEIASLWGVATTKILAWIRSGELRAIDASTKRSKRPRYLIDVEDLKAFEEKRLVRQPPKTVRKPQRAADVIPFY